MKISPGTCATRRLSGAFLILGALILLADEALRPSPGLVSLLFGSASGNCLMQDVISVSARYCSRESLRRTDLVAFFLCFGMHRHLAEPT